MNEDKILEVLDRLEKRLTKLEDFLIKPINTKPYIPDTSIFDKWKDMPEDCMHKNFKPDVPVGISCPCPRCSPYALSYPQTTNGDQTKFSSGSIQGAIDGASQMKPEIKL